RPGASVERGYLLAGRDALELPPHRGADRGGSGGEVGAAAHFMLLLASASAEAASACFLGGAVVSAACGSSLSDADSGVPRCTLSAIRSARSSFVAASCIR